MIKINSIIVEDESVAQNGLLQYVQRIDFMDVKALCSDAIEATNVLSENSIDLIFLDINLPEVNGIDFLKTLTHPPMVIITTAYPNFALQGFEENVLDYLVKPFSFERFLKAANKALHFYQLKSDGKTSTRDQFIFVKTDKRYEKVLIDEILYVEGTQNYITLHTCKAKLVVLSSMKTIESLLPAPQFLRIHKSYLVSVRAIQSIEAGEVVVGSIRLPLSRERRAEVIQQLHPL